MTEENALVHPRTRETVEQCARRFLRIATTPGASSDRDIARNTAFKLMLQSHDETERLFYGAVNAWLSDG